MRELDYPKEVEEKVLEGVRRVCETKQTVKDHTAYTSPTGASDITNLFSIRFFPNMEMLILSSALHGILVNIKNWKRN